MENHDVSCETLYTHGHTGHNYQWIVFDQNRFGDTLVSDLNSASSDEIDLIELFTTFWEGKWKIVAAIIFSLASVVFYEVAKAPTSFRAETKFEPINLFEAEKYAASNALGFFEISPDKLFDLYYERLLDKEIFKQAIVKYKILDRSDFESETHFREALKSLVSKVEIVAPRALEKTNPLERRPWTINFEFNDEAKWMKAIGFVHNTITDSVRTFLKAQFLNKIEVESQRRNHKLEDLNIQIENIIADYDTKVSNRIAYLKEQALIARALGVAKNTLGPLDVSLQNNIVANFSVNIPYYLNGYEAIEEEMRLIMSRGDKLAFVDGLLELEQSRRTLKQDLSLKRAKELFGKTPIMKDAEFTPVLIDVEATEFIHDGTFSLRLALAIVIGGFIGAAYVLIQRALAKRRSYQSLEWLEDVR